MSTATIYVTAKQERVLEYVKTMFLDQGIPPTVRQIMVHFLYSSTNAVQGHMNALVRKGLIRRVVRGGKSSYVPVVEDGCCPCCGRPI